MRWRARPEWRWPEPRRRRAGGGSHPAGRARRGEDAGAFLQPAPPRTGWRRGAGRLSPRGSPAGQTWWCVENLDVDPDRPLIRRRDARRHSRGGVGVLPGRGPRRGLRQRWHYCTGATCLAEISDAALATRSTTGWRRSCRASARWARFKRGLEGGVRTRIPWALPTPARSRGAGATDRAAQATASPSTTPPRPPPRRPARESESSASHAPTGGRAFPLTLCAALVRHRPVRPPRDLPGSWKGSWATCARDAPAATRRVCRRTPPQPKPTARAKPRGT